MTPIEIMFATQAALRETFDSAVNNKQKAFRKHIYAEFYKIIITVTGSSIDRLGALAGVSSVKNEQRFEDRFEAEEPARDYSTAPSRDVKINVLQG